MTPQELRDRTQRFARDVVSFADPLLQSDATRHMALQLVRAATGVAANYRAACRARSHAEFTAKVGLVLEEADESMYWLESLEQRPAVSESARQARWQESCELVAIFSAAVRTARRRHQRPRNK